MRARHAKQLIASGLSSHAAVGWPLARALNIGHFGPLWPARLSPSLFQRQLRRCFWPVLAEALPDPRERLPQCVSLALPSTDQWPESPRDRLRYSLFVVGEIRQFLLQVDLSPAHELFFVHPWILAPRAADCHAYLAIASGAPDAGTISALNIGISAWSAHWRGREDWRVRSRHLVENQWGASVPAAIKLVDLETIIELSNRARKGHINSGREETWLRTNLEASPSIVLRALLAETDWAFAQQSGRKPRRCWRCLVLARRLDGGDEHFTMDVYDDDFHALPSARGRKLLQAFHRVADRVSISPLPASASLPLE